MFSSARSYPPILGVRTRLAPPEVTAGAALQSDCRPREDVSSEGDRRNVTRKAVLIALVAIAALETGAIVSFAVAAGHRRAVLCLIVAGLRPAFVPRDHG